MAVRNGVGWAGLDAISTKNAAGIINVIDARVAFSRRNSLGVGVFRSLDVDAPGRAGRRAQKTANAFFQSAFVPVKNVDAAIARLEMDGFFGIIFRDGFPQHVTESDAKAFYERKKSFARFLNDGRHRN